MIDPHALENKLQQARVRLEQLDPHYLSATFVKETRMRIILKKVRLAFLDTLFTAAPFPGGQDPTPYYNAKGILTPEHPQLPELKKAIEAVAKEEWPKEWANVLKAAYALGKVCLQDGDTKPNWDGFPGNWFISARSKVRPNVKDRDGRTTLTAQDGRPYSGSYGNLHLDIFAYKKPMKGIAAQLCGVQYVEAGDAFSGGRPSSDDEFEDVSMEGDDDLAA